MTPRLALALALLGATEGLGPDDLEAYRVALGSRPDPSAPLVRFGDLWGHPESYAGRSVRVEGRLARLFRQPASGNFPPLAEGWIVSEAGDPTCLVFPAPEGGPLPPIGAPVRFAGTYLRRLRYKGGDAPRLAPLVVGAGPPTTRLAAAVSGPSWSRLDWALGLGAASVVALALARRHLARPPELSRAPGPDPLFVDEPGPTGPAGGGSPDDDRG